MRSISMLDLGRQYQYMKANIDAAVAKCFGHQQWILGPEVKLFEDEIAGYIGSKNCIGVASGTDALVLALRALAIQSKNHEYFDKKDKIITTPFTFTATGDAILRSGATPVFIDIDPATYSIDTARIKEYLASNPKDVAGILPVHLYGRPANMDEIIAIANNYKIFVVEDAAQAFGAAWREKRLGSLGTMAAFSFFPSKNLGGSGDGGAVSTDDSRLADLVRMLLKHGGKDKYNVDHIGYNSRLDTLQAAILLAKFKFIDEFNKKRNMVADAYDKFLGSVAGIVLPVAPDENYRSIYNQYTLRVVNGKRDSLQNKLKEAGIPTVVYYPTPLNYMKVFKGRCETPFTLEASEQAACEVLSLPIDPLLTIEEINYICETIKNSL